MCVICVLAYCNMCFNAGYEVCVSYHGQLAAEPKISLSFNVEIRHPTQLYTVSSTDRQSVLKFIQNFIILMFIRYFETSPYTIGDLHGNLFCSELFNSSPTFLLIPTEYFPFSRNMRLYSCCVKETPLSVRGTSN